jgi:hypothetical protein
LIFFFRLLSPVFLKENNRVSRKLSKTLVLNAFYLNDPELIILIFFDDLDRAKRYQGHFFRVFTQNYKINEKS